jgi:hypothetical protein
MNLTIHQQDDENERASETVGFYERAAKVSSLKLSYNAPENKTFSPLVPGILGNASKFLYRDGSTFAAAGMYSIYAPLIALLPLSGHHHLQHLYCLLFPLVFVFFVFSLVWVRLFLYYGKNTARALRAPTTITVAPLSMKFQWQGWALFPQLAAIETIVGWQDIVGVAFENVEETGPCITIKAWLQDGEHSFPVYLNGFASMPETEALLNALDRNVDEEKKSESFKDFVNSHRASRLLDSMRAALPHLETNGDHQFHPNVVAKQI